MPALQAPPSRRANTDFWSRKFQLNEERDGRKMEALEEAGWTVVVVWECELRDGPEGLPRLPTKLLSSAP